MTYSANERSSFSRARPRAAVSINNLGRDNLTFIGARARSVSQPVVA